MRRTAALLLSLAAASAPLALARDTTDVKPRRPRLDLRVTPRMAFSPAFVLTTAELVGGHDSEDFHCPALEWDWDDGSRSVHEEDCAPFDASSPMERRFTAQHAFRQAGEYTVKVTFRRANRTLAVQTVKVIVRPGAADALSE